MARVLVVEDEPRMRGLLEQVIAGEGHEPVIATDGVHAPALATRSHVDDRLPARAFERFTRSERSRANGTAGSGIGLALVRALVLSAGGEVTVSNRPGGGAEAVVALPLVEAGTRFV